VSSLEGLQEFLEDLVLGLLSSLDIWMLVGLVDTSDVININPTIAIFVEFLESLSNNLLSSHVHWSSDGAEELIVGDGTTAVDIEVIEEGADLTLAETEHEVVHGFAELVFVETLGVIVIHNLELSLETNDTSGTTGGQFLLELNGEGLGVSTTTTSGGSLGLDCTKSSGSLR